ncbi:hypothetical protein [Malikia sp.]|uniref:hypothetical protein n=1 Tax=Malikia sp. TaxID=2070706 RepID=UPI0026155A32|nr:hypothetical protein [Malikia sp.]MDD2730138.1 hypothetical protein [Malikia sp.]
MASTIASHEHDAHLPAWAYRALALVAAVIGLAASGVTARFFIIGLERTEADSLARDVLILAGVLMVVTELAAFFIAALVPRRQLRALRWQLTMCALLLVGFEFATIAVTQIVLAKSADAVHDGTSGRIAHLKSSIDAQRATAAALVATGSRSGQSTIASSRAEGVQALREASRIEGRTAALSAELAQLQAEQRPTLKAVLGESLTLAYQCARAGLITVMGLVMFAASGALLRAGRQTGRTLAVAGPVAPAAVAAPQTQATPKGTTAALPTWRRYALPASALAAGAGLAAMAPTPAQAIEAPMQTQETATPDAPTTDVSTTLHPSVVTPLHHSVVTTLQAGSTALVTEQVDNAPAQTTTPTRKARRAAAPRAAAMRDTGVGEDDGARFLRVKEGIEARRIKPSIRAIYSAEGASQQVARRYLLALEQAGIIELAGQGKGYRLTRTA